MLFLSKILPTGQRTGVNALLLLACIGWCVQPSNASAQCQIFWTDEASNQILRLGERETFPSILISGVDQPSFLAMDVRGAGSLYITSEANGTIAAANLDGSGLTTLLDGLDSPRAIAVDPANNKLYWAETKITSDDPEVVATGSIRRANLDGTNVETVLSGLSFVGDIAIIPTTQRLYWSESIGFDAHLKSATLDGDQIKTLATVEGDTGDFEDRGVRGLGLAVESESGVPTSIVWSLVGASEGSVGTTTSSARFDRVSLSDNQSTTVIVPFGRILSTRLRFVQKPTSVASGAQGKLFWTDPLAYGSIWRFDPETDRQNLVLAPPRSINSMRPVDVVLLDENEVNLCSEFNFLFESQRATVWRPSSGDWFFRHRINQYERYSDVLVEQWGLPGDVPLIGDTNADGLEDIVVWRPSGGNWFDCFTRDVFSPEDFNCTVGAVQQPTQFGLPGDRPILADFDGDGKSDITVWRPITGEWYTQRSSDEVITQTQWGLPGDIPLAADFDGDGVSDLVVWRPSEGNWYARLSSREFSSSFDSILFKQWGLPEDHPMPGDYDGDNESDLVVWRPSTGTWFLCFSSNDFDCSANESVQFGLPDDIPVSMDFDADGRLDYVVWRPSSGVWFYRSSATGLILQQQWGLLGDLPVPASSRTLFERLTN